LSELGYNGQVFTESIHTAPNFLSWSANIWGASQVNNLAEWLYGGATLPLIIASIILLLAMVAPIVLCKEDSL
jgi:NADH:ubiquinone oxidoreductase subunit 6 (subunit J)